MGVGGITMVALAETVRLRMTREDVTGRLQTLVLLNLPERRNNKELKAFRPSLREGLVKTTDVTRETKLRLC